MALVLDALLSVGSFVTDLIVEFGYAGIFLSTVLECFIPPIPSEIILPFSGFVASTGRLEFAGVLLAATLGSLAGALALYFLAMRAGRPLLVRYGRYVLVSERDIARAEGWFKKYGPAVVFFSRLLPLVRSLISLPAGAARMDLKKFIIYTALGSAIWNFMLIYAGFALGERWGDVGSLFDQLEPVIALALLLVIGYLAYTLLKKKSRR